MKQEIITGLIALGLFLTFLLVAIGEFPDSYFAFVLGAMFGFTICHNKK